MSASNASADSREKRLEVSSEQETVENAPPSLLPFLKSLLARNPFYPASALVLLYGIGTLSADSSVAGEETRQLYFNFGSLLIYELLLVGMAWFLARRCILYDSQLLVVLENMLVFVPFLLVGQATLLDSGVATVLCVSGSLLVLGRFAVQRWAITRLRLPVNLFILGTLFLLIHLFFPLFFRKVANWDNEAWDRCSPWFWILLLPALQALMLRLTAGAGKEEQNWSASWLGPLILTLWTGATAIHVASMDYVGDVLFHVWKLGPILWMVGWTWAIWFVRNASISAPWRYGVMLIPMAAPLVSLSHEILAFGLSAVQLAGLVTIAAAYPRDRRLWAVAGAAATMLIAMVPMRWGLQEVEGFTRLGWIAVCLGAVGTGATFLKRDPRCGFLGAVLTLIWMSALPWPMQLFPLGGFMVALMILLAHSLLWEEEEHRDARNLRRITALIWGGVALAMSYGEPLMANWVTPFTGGFLLLILLVRTCLGFGSHAVLWCSACLVLASRPLILGCQMLKELPAGYAVVGVSFLLFALGTIVAITKPRWNR